MVYNIVFTGKLYSNKGGAVLDIKKIFEILNKEMKATENNQSS
ncbi:hypothetical protein [Clostridium diolis]|uniref:Uncharacterized protein n=1 Tax=Clostridium diolis TaxID=223919 RepID=A0AAV3W7Q2_9CLOT|nr:hypothetical protein [Clostridium diolis]GEA33034.1 hypothetical protein CDIOL_39570 [Clostridium diolis]